LAITNAIIAEDEQGVNVAATPKGFFEVFMQPVLDKKDGAKKGQKLKGGYAQALRQAQDRL
jgi:proteasome lid subunit RPN8/RPN11